MRVWLPAVRTGTGTDVFTLRLQAGLSARGVDAIITWFPGWYEFLPELMRGRAMPSATNIIHANAWLAAPYIGRGTPVVATVHHLVHDPAYAPYCSFAQSLYHRWHIRGRELRALLRAEVVTAVTSYVAHSIQKFSGREQVSVIPNWVDTVKYSPDPAWVSDSARPFRLLLVGNHSRRKGFDLLPALCAELGPDFELRCTGGLRDSSMTGLRGVRLLGRLSEEDLVSEYQACHAVISLSRYEGFGYTALEGMACGKPVVAFDTSGITEVIEDGVTGFLASKDDVAALAARCRELLENRGLTERMGYAARRRAIERFPEAGAIDAYIQTYERIIREGGPIL